MYFWVQERYCLITNVTVDNGVITYGLRSAVVGAIILYSSWLTIFDKIRYHCVYQIKWLKSYRRSSRTPSNYYCFVYFFIGFFFWIHHRGKVPRGVKLHVRHTEPETSVLVDRYQTTTPNRICIYGDFHRWGSPPPGPSVATTRRQISDRFTSYNGMSVTALGATVFTIRKTFCLWIFNFVRLADSERQRVLRRVNYNKSHWWDEWCIALRRRVFFELETI